MILSKGVETAKEEVQTCDTDSGYTDGDTVRSVHSTVHTAETSSKPSDKLSTDSEVDLEPPTPRDHKFDVNANELWFLVLIVL